MNDSKECQACMARPVCSRALPPGDSECLTFHELRLQAVVDYLFEYGVIRSKIKVPTKAPTHGPCCTCQACGYPNDECVCYTNEILDNLLKMAGEDEKE